mmetsp:Transcript_38510/g.115539  ORF Transcript_38510/g.115539 Transcript_38510/m.115539 type:complete len:245 (-) Transcript_38510:227-961(-)|eukprot:CAMPEP_0113532146 /NCGR_PEP_ID=MMETSP0015_2-20120614/3892_1 /TAXON_ID=2838 /ORGANISM="Odontella" /LENGTH=244 /DNA_ID=CAMNT_0000431065 /DNA_START=111 /DNA_END=845 /DNA_ORIENTATION=+ /assembly_acc=CAM_ASM_000160
MMANLALGAFAFSHLVVPVVGYSFRPFTSHVYLAEQISNFNAQVPVDQERCAIGDVGRRYAMMRSLAAAIGVVAVGDAPWVASATEMPSEFKNVGGQAPAPEGETPFRTLSDGVQVKDFRAGTGDVVVGNGSKVAVQMTGRLLNLNGVVFYDTKKNNPDGFGGLPLSFTMGDGTALPGLESGLRGMGKGGIRRIIVPPELGYTNFPGREPIPLDGTDQRALDSVIKNPRRDATLLFDVKLERVK